MSTEESTDDELAHSDYLSHCLTESVALKQLNAAQDLSQILQDVLEKVQNPLEDWSEEASSSSNNNIKEIKSILAELDANGQKEHIINLLSPVDAKCQTLVRKLDRQKVMFQNSLELLKPIFVSLSTEKDLEQIERQTLKLKPHGKRNLFGSILKIFRRSRSRSRTPSKCVVKAMPSPMTNVPSNPAPAAIPPKDTDRHQLQLHRRQTEEQPIQLQIVGERTAGAAAVTVTSDINLNVASTRMAIETDIYKDAEVGHGEAKEIQSNRNKQILIDQIIAAADAKWMPRPGTTDTDDDDNPPASTSSVSIEEAAAGVQNGYDSENNEMIELSHCDKGADEHLKAIVTSSTSDSFTLNEDQISEEDWNRNEELISTMKYIVNDLKNKVEHTIAQLRRIEEPLYSLNSPGSKFNLHSNSKGITEFKHLIAILKETGTLFLQHSPIYNEVLYQELKKELCNEILVLQNVGNECCRKYEELYHLVEGSLVEFTEVLENMRMVTTESIDC